MRTYILFTITIVLVSLFSSCLGGDPVAWNAEIVNIHNQTVAEVEDFEDLISLETVGDAETNKHIQNKGTQFLAYLDQSISLISESEVPSGAEDCQQAMLTYLEGVKEQINIGTKFTNFTEATSEVEIDNYADNYDVASASTAKKANVFLKEQQEFAKSVGIE